MINAKLILTAVTIAVSGFSVGCVSLLPNAAEAPSIYRLSEIDTVSSGSSSGPTIRVSIPGSPKAFHGIDVVVSPDGQRLAYASGAQWAEPIPRLVQSAAVKSLEAQGGLIPVKPPTAARADYALEMDIRAFEAYFDNGEMAAPLARVKINATLTDLKTRRIVATREFFASRRASERRVSRIVAAQDDAAKAVLTELSEWISLNSSAPRPAS